MQSFGYRENLFDDINKISYTWLPFENVYYNKTELAKYTFHSKDESTLIRVDIDGFMVATAKNGGPFALLLNNKIIHSGAGSYKDKIMVLSAYGDRIATLDLKKILKKAYEQDINHWALFEFTKEEDILLISSNGHVIILDPMSGEILSKHNFHEQFAGKNGIENAKARDNSVILKTGLNCFYYIHDIYHPEISEFGKPNFDLHNEIDEVKGTVKTTSLPQKTTIDDYLMIPKAKSWSKKLEILITHPKEGLLLLDDQQKCTYTSDMSHFWSDDVGRLGTITNLALSANDSLLTFFSTTNSCLYVFKSDLLKLLNKVETGKPRPEKLIWCANDVPILIYQASITMIGPK